MLIPEELILDQIEAGPMGNFQYFIGDKATKEVAIVDLGWDTDSILDFAKQNNYKIVALLLTHGHYDHIQAIEALPQDFRIPIYISKHEPDLLHPQGVQCQQVSDGESIKIGSVNIECIHTPGHSPGCQCFRYKNILLTGDTLFIDGCGRCDLPGSDPGEMFDSLYNKILSFKEDTLIFPGHFYGRSKFDSLGNLKQNNSFLKFSSKEEFVNYMS